MVAVMAVQWDFGGTNGSPGTTATTITNLRFNNEDTNDQDTASPVTVVASTTVYSFQKNVYLKATTGPATSCSNFKLYSDGASGLGTGISVKILDTNPTHNSGSTAGYVIGAASSQGAGTSVFTYTSGSARTITCSEAGSLIDATGESTNYQSYQLELLDTASPGTTPTETLTYSYDEI